MNKYQALKDALDGTSSVNWEHDQGADIYEVGTGILIASTMETEDGAYVAAAQPSTIRQLLADLESAQQEAQRYRALRDGQGWPAVFASSDAPEPLRGGDLDAELSQIKERE